MQMDDVECKSQKSESEKMPSKETSADQFEISNMSDLENVQRGEALGEGSYGKVFKGLYKGNNPNLPPSMAIKLIEICDRKLP